MAKADREILEELYARWNADEPDLALDLFGEEVDIHQNPDILDTVGTGRVSGASSPVTVAHAWKLRDGKVTHFYVYPTMSEAVRALQAQASD